MDQRLKLDKSSGISCFIANDNFIEIDTGLLKFIEVKYKLILSLHNME